ncbi:hypothetical protein [Streptomyces sp. NPDC020681]|uniref:hypothetical protein n=1 Tax=Streptomyces sp. NPDC020681 TaxID=3365083 RepID=UPI00379257BE
MPRSEMTQREMSQHERPRREFRHGFRPGKLVAGMAVLAATLLYAGDAAGSWQTPWFVVFPVVFGGLFLAGAVSWTHYSVRRRRSARLASMENTAAPASTNGSQAIR